MRPDMISLFCKKFSHAFTFLCSVMMTSSNGNIFGVTGVKAITRYILMQIVRLKYLYSLLIMFT